MAIVVESTTDAIVTGSSSITITKPSGLAVGDLIVALLSSYNATFNTLSGWTAVESLQTGEIGVTAQYKVADSSDVAASNFTFTNTGNTAFSTGALMRISGYNTLSPFEYTEAIGDTNANSATVSRPISVTPTNNALLIMLIGAAQGAEVVATMTGYNVTGLTTTWTEILDRGAAIAGGNSSSAGAAYSVISTAAALTAFGATISTTREDHAGIFLSLQPRVDGTATNALLEVQPATFQPVVTNTNTVSNNLLEVLPTINDANADAINRSQWTNEPGTSTTWTNESQP